MCSSDLLAALIVGRGGLTLAEAFERDGMSAYRGTTIAGFPNLYILQGPNTGLGHSSVVLMTEAQVAYLTPAVASGMVLEVDPVKRRISLGLKQTLANPWETFSEKYPIGSIVEGEVKNKTEFGLFVGLDGDVDGMVHLSDLD